MASVTINSGEPEADDRPDRIPKDKWRNLMWVKRDFAKTRIKYDCRCLLEFIQDAEIMWQELGFESAEDMVCNGYELDPAEVELALAWLEIKDPGEAVPFRDAVKEGRRLAGHGGDRKSKKQVDNINLNHSGGTGKDYLIARLARDHQEILSDYEQGRYKSVRQAVIAAGIVKVPRPFDVALKQVEKMDRQELIDLKIRIDAILKG